MKTTRRVINRSKVFFALLISISLQMTSVVTFASTERNTAISQTQANKHIKIALLLDTSNSMDGLIEQAKSQLWTIVNELSSAKCEDDSELKIRIALYEYGNDWLSAESGYIKQVCPLTNDLDQISEKLFALRTNGGDEYCGQVIQTSLADLEWGTNENDLKMIFIAGNEAFTQGKINYREACLKAKKSNIVVNTIFCGNFDQGVNSNWKSGADLTGGSYMSIEQNRKTVFIDSPYDDRLDSLNTALNNTYIPYGNQGRLKKANQMQQDLNAETYGKANKVKRAITKSSVHYDNKNWDLVDASKESDEVIEQIDIDDLPEEMKSLDKEERKNYIQTKSEERGRIQSEIQSLSTKRKTYIAAQSSNGNQESSLDQAMIQALKKQAIAKGLKFAN